MTEYSHEKEIYVRYADTDAMGHINNATYATYLETARSSYYDAIVGEFPDGVETVVAKLMIDYHGEIRYGDAVAVAVGVVELGETSFEMAYNVKTDGVTVATSRTVIITVDSKTGESRPIPDDWRCNIQEFEEHK